MLLINGYIGEMNMQLKKVLSREVLERWMDENKNWDFRAIYFSFRLNERL
jgi:hypothetical protein